MKKYILVYYGPKSESVMLPCLVAEARVIRRCIAQGAWRRACLAPKARPRVPGGCLALPRTRSSDHRCRAC